MNKESNPGPEIYVLPKESAAKFNFSVNSTAFEPDLRLLIERNDRNESGIISRILNIGHEFVIADSDVSFGLRPRIGGSDEVIDLMDDRFAYDKAASINEEKKNMRDYFIPEKTRDTYMEKANQLGIDIEELFARILQAGMYMFIEVRENEKYAYKEKGDQRFLLSMSVPSQKKELKRRLNQFYRQYDNKSQSPDSAQH